MLCGTQDEVIRIKNVKYDKKTKSVAFSDYGVCEGCNSSIESLSMNPIQSNIVAAG